MRSFKWLGAVGTILVLATFQLQAAPQDDGQWSPVVDWPTIAIHSVLTPQGKVMNFGTDESGLQGAQFFFDVWDPKLGTGANSHYTLPNTLGVDSFCSAAVLLPETGNILMSGGDNRPNGGKNLGINDAVIYNTQSNSLSRAADMKSARWYPTSTVLPNGEILLSGGIDAGGYAVTTPEVYSPATNQWRSLFGASTEDHNYFYPRHWVAPNGLIFGYTSATKMYYIDPKDNGSLQPLGSLDIIGNFAQGTAVMYQPGKILQVGGTGSVTNDAAIININGATPYVRSINRPANAGRVWANSVVLPNGKVMIVGGSAKDNELNDTSFRPEIWDPATEAWTQMAPSVKSRLYHSTALLLKDGRVMVAGGGAPGPQVNTNAELFSPPYLFNNAGQAARRPSIVTAPAEARYASKITVRHNASDVISRVTLIKTGAVTHSFNMEQRFLELDFEDINNGVKITMPGSANLAPPGYYLLHLLDNKGVPSEAHIIRISGTAELDTGSSSPTAFPRAMPDSVNVTGSGVITIDVLANDIGSGLTLSAPEPWSLKGGSVALANNKITYTPNAGFTGEDKIWYSFSDNQGRSNFGEVLINVNPRNANEVTDITATDITRGGGSFSWLMLLSLLCLLSCPIRKRRLQST